MTNRVLSPSGRALSAADLTIDVCLAPVAHPSARPDPGYSRPKTRPHSGNGSDTRSARSMSGSITISMAAPPHRILVRMHLLPASRG